MFSSLKEIVKIDGTFFNESRNLPISIVRAWMVLSVTIAETLAKFLMKIN
jgi:hypothetical protein